MRRARTWLGAIGRYWLVLIVGALSTLIAFGLGSSDRVAQLEFEIEQRLQMRLSPAARSKKLVVVEITPKDTPMTSSGPARSVPRHIQAEFVDLLKKAGAKVLIIDLKYDAHPQPNEDPHLRDAILNSSPLGIAICQLPNQVQDDQARNGYRYLSFIKPTFLPRVLPENVELGQSESVDTGGTTGSVALVCQDESTGKYVQNLALIAFRQLHSLLADSVTADWTNSRLIVDTDAFQMGPDGDLVVDWQGEQDDYPTLGFTAAMSALRAGDPSRTFLKKVVILANVQGDPTVETVAGQKVGFQMLASATNTLIRTDLRKPHQLGLEVAVTWSALLALLMSLAASLRMPGRVLGAVVIIGVVVWLLPVICIATGLGILSTTMPALSSLAALILGTVSRTTLPHVYPVPITGPFEATVLVVDIKNSTPLVDQLGPIRGGALLSKGVSIATREVAREGGEVVRETGDGVVAIFRATVAHEHAAAAVRTALQLITLSHGLGGVMFRTGIESGALVQSRDGLQGLPFHIAARLEAQCSIEDEVILVGPTAAVLSRAAFAWETLGTRNLKGINLPVEIFRMSQTPS